MEVLDIIDEQGNVTGKTADRDTVHEKGLFHRHVTIWIMNEKGELLFQKRSGNKKRAPNKWSRTGGHVDAGEEPKLAIQREIQEELGVTIPWEKIELMQINKGQKQVAYDFWDCYISYEYIVVVNYKIQDYQMQKEEVSDLAYISIEEMEKIKQQNDTNYTFINWENFETVINLLKKRREKICVKK